MKQVQVPKLTEIALQKAQSAKDLGTVIPAPDKFYVVVDTSVVVPTQHSGQASLQSFIDNELGTIIILSVNDYVHVQTSRTQITGTVTVEAGGKDVVGTETTFSSLHPGDTISVASQEVEIDTIMDNEHLTLVNQHQYGAANSIVFIVEKEWWQYTSGDGTQQAHYTAISYDPENQAGISSNGLYYPDPENILTNYTANFVKSPSTGVAFFANLTSDDYFQSAVDLKSMYIKIRKIAGAWALGVQANIILVVDTEGDLFSIIHSNGSDFTAPAEWELTPEYNFSDASILEGMIVDSLKRTVEANSLVAQIETSYQTVRQIARKMGKNADLVVGTVTQNEQRVADHLIDNWIADLIADSRIRVLFREGSHVPATDWNITEKVNFDFDRNAKLDMTDRTHSFLDLTGRVVLENAGSNSLVITRNCDGLILESDNFNCLDISTATGTVIHNGRVLLGQAAATGGEPVRKNEHDANISGANSYTDSEITSARGYTDSEITSARDYTDSEITSARGYTDSEVSNVINLNDTELADTTHEIYFYKGCIAIKTTTQ